MNKEPGYVYILTNPSFRVISRTDPVISRVISRDPVIINRKNG